MKNTRHVCQRRAENDKNSAAFATTSKVFALIEEFSKESRRIAAGIRGPAAEKRRVGRAE